MVVDPTTHNKKHTFLELLLGSELAKFYEEPEEIKKELKKKKRKKKKNEKKHRRKKD
jgi:hypothetical protein